MRGWIDFIFVLVALSVTFAATYFVFELFPRDRWVRGGYVLVQTGNLLYAIAAFCITAILFIVFYRRVICRLVP